MEQGKLIGFTDNFADNSTEAGFQFTFYCDICREGYKTGFIEAKSYKKRKFLQGLGGIVSAVTQIAGQYGVGYGVEKATDVITERFRGMSPEWHKEHEAAFEIAQNEAKNHFHRCPKCTKWVCENDWNEQEGLCTLCAPRVNVEVAAAKAQKAVQDIREKAASTQIFTGEIESKQTICPNCGKPAGEGKFCSNCGAPLDLIKCPKCGAKNNASARFCGECGTRLS
ncbi:zinc ribbon domain-containing protein [Thermospira aquatica]|uniref:Zinc ribbon domain-containing protein n=1 Tax=Thermospira aquatica TaxID=2828656 RepID=A0AAX3BDD5_9SPIR|nr:zinc ribbon domain-containing protein [Thermospira aquatica]URA10342.1 zinc ribbon domain-containing protein [Thermospira aquatica]